MTKVQKREGCRFILQFPEGYDERTHMTVWGNKIVVIHPDFRPCYIEDNKLVEITP